MELILGGTYLVTPIIYPRGITARMTLLVAVPYSGALQVGTAERDKLG